MTTKAELLKSMHDGWAEFQAYLDSLAPADFTTNTDAAGWTAKDHVMHLAVWEDGIWALLEKQSRREQMGLDEATWQSGDYDRMNAVIQQAHRDKSLDEVFDAFRDVHRRLIAKIESMRDDDLQQPYRTYQPDADREEPVIQWIAGNTYEHYAEHQPYIARIIAG